MTEPLSTQSDVAWLGYKDGQLVAIELEGFHAGETVERWEAKGYRVELVTNEQAIRRWRMEYPRVPTCGDLALSRPHPSVAPSRHLPWRG